MQHSRLYVLQLLGIIMLVAGYFISDIPDSRSEMHFNLSSSHVIRAVQHSAFEGFAMGSGTSFSTNDKSSHKTRTIKYFSGKVIIPRQAIEYHYVPLLSVVHIAPLPETYCYLFCEEINPPPPKSC